jgi:hypothetical protein
MVRFGKLEQVISLIAYLALSPVSGSPLTGQERQRTVSGGFL